MGSIVTSKRVRVFPYWTGTQRQSNGTLSHSDKNYGESGSPYVGVNSLGRGIAQTTTSYRSVVPTNNGALTNEQILLQAELEGRKSLFPYDTGHAFQTEDYSVKTFPSHDWTVNGVGLIQWKGNVNLSCYATNGFAALPQGDLNVLGARAINATVPTKPVASIAEFLAQLKSGQELPSLAGVTTSVWSGIDTALLSAFGLKEIIGVFLQKGGDSYLNLEYGWAPFVNDIKSLANAVLKSNKVVKQLIRDNGRPVRRSFYFPEIRTTTVLADSISANTLQNTKAVFNFNAGIGDLHTIWGPLSGQISSVLVNSQQQWFKGEYIYHLPNGDNLGGLFDLYTTLAQKLVGTELTPIALWDLAPWSWLADWFADFSTVISNGTLFSDPKTNLVLRYGYMMETSSSTLTTVAIGLKLGTNNFGNLSTSIKHTLKRRIQATPYGFGLDVSKFSDYQWAILAALGLSSGGSALHRK